ncbi:MAG TPA: hypothetical protein VEZ26_04730 [Sphingomonadaceae bacterium]|nr:hypothetical protein [Sphingomonadaceae bacterium]
MQRHIVHGWLVDPAARAALLALHPPRYEQVVAEHVTFKAGPEESAMPEVDHCLAVGMADDGLGVQALVVAIDGTTERPDGSTWHITWSLAETRRAKESNDVIATQGWEALAEPRHIPLIPGWWTWTSG